MNRNIKLAFGASGIALFMLSLSFAAAPFYNWFCRTTGFAGTPRVAAFESASVGKKIIDVRFDATLSPGLDFAFRPVDKNVILKPGETLTVYYQIENLSDDATTVRAAYNVTPEQAGAYFIKLDCFCFTEQAFGAREQRDLGVTFYIDPEIENDDGGRPLENITLSYTLFQAPDE